MNQRLVSTVAAVGLATTLTGCCIPFTGTCLGPTTTSSAPSTTTQTTTVPAQACSHGSKMCAEYLNRMYYGYEENSTDGPLGVPLRGRTRFNEEEYWFFCEDQCFQPDGFAYADCNVQSSLINHKVMIDADSHTPLYNPDTDTRAKEVFAYSIFVIFYEDVVREKLTRCAYQYDGATFNRGNGGCGLGMGDRNCDDPASAFGGRCPDEGSPETLYAYQDECQATQSQWCGSEEMKGKSYPEVNCFWKGPAWKSPSYEGAEADLSVLSKNNELPDMLKQRLESQEDGQTEDGIPYLNYWNELVVDGRVLKKLLDTEPEKVVAAWGYTVDGRPEAAGEDERVLEDAKRFRDEHFEKYGVSVPLVSVNLHADVSKKEDVFGPGPEETTTGAPSEGPFVESQFV